MKKERWLQIGCAAAAVCVIGGTTLLARAGETLDVESAVAGVAIPLNNYYASSLNPEEELRDFLDSEAITSLSPVAETAAETETPQAQSEMPEQTAPTETSAPAETSAPTETTAPAETTEAATQAPIEAPAETQAEAPRVSRYANVAVSQVRDNSYVRVRQEPNTEAEILGKLYNDCAATILNTVDGEDGVWYEIKSGSVQGYIKAEYFLTGDEAEARAIEIGKLEGRVNTNGLRLRSEPNLESEILTLLYSGEKYIVIEEGDEFVKIMVDDDLEGYVFREMIDVSVKFDTAISLEEERQKEEEEARKKKEAAEAQRKLEEAKKKEAERKKAEAAAAAQAAEGGSEGGEEAPAPAPAPSDVSNASRDALVAYAKQWVGVTPYVSGGTSLTNGADCSGFTQAVYREALGVSIPRDSRSQASGAVTISESELQPGDLVFYNGGGKTINHVAIYIGGGQVVHASNSKTGTIISNMKYREPCQYGRYID